MASFDEHIAQAKCILGFLEKINGIGDNFIDWQVTTNFYVSVHLIIIINRPNSARSLAPSLIATLSILV